MPHDGIAEAIKQFIFTHIDSVEQLEVLFLMRSDPQREWSAEGLSTELRSNPTSVDQRLRSLERFQLIRKSERGTYLYEGTRPELDELVAQLSELYQSRRHKILELVFSPLKRARDFADAFKLSGPKGGNDNGHS